jgi:ABC-type transport system substrate-binding protein
MRHFLRNGIPATVLVLLALLSLFPGRAHADAPTLKVGIPEEPRTLNVWMATDANSRKVLSMIYQPLYVRDPETLRLTPWLAEAMPVYDRETVSYTVELRDARWADGTSVTAEDVVFTVNLIQRFKVPKYQSKWECVEKTVAVDDQTVRFYLKEPVATFVTRTLINYIAPKSEWQPIAEKAEKQEKPLRFLLNQKIDRPLGCGPFTLEKWQAGNYLYLKKNPHFFGSGEMINKRRLGPHIDAVLFKVYGTADVAIMALKKGSIDFLWWAIQPGYLEDLQKDEAVRVFISQKSALYFMGFNVRKAPFSDPALRQAAAVLIDKDFIVERILQGYATRMDSIVPAENQFWYEADVPAYGSGLARPERIRKAHAVLEKNGYSWQRPPVAETGKIVDPSTIRLPSGEEMEKFTILTPPADYDPNRATCGIMIQEWLNTLGIPASARPMAFGALLENVKRKHDFDAFVLGYGRLSLDPDYLRSFFHSQNNKPGGWNMSGYTNPEFDRLADRSAEAMDDEERRELIHRMQQIVMGDVPYIPLYKPAAIEAVRRGGFTGWEQMVGGIGNLWSICQVQPAD